MAQLALEDKPEQICQCGVPTEIHHNTACGWEYASIPFLPFEKITFPMNVSDKIERWTKWKMFWESVNNSTYFCTHKYDLYRNDHGETVAVCSKCMNAYF